MGCECETGGKFGNQAEEASLWLLSLLYDTAVNQLPDPCSRADQMIYSSVAPGSAGQSIP